MVPFPRWPESSSLLSPLDNHDVISLKLFELTVERTPEEEKLHRDVFLPSVDNMKLPESECGVLGQGPMAGRGWQCQHGWGDSQA